MRPVQQALPTMLWDEDGDQRTAHIGGLLLFVERIPGTVPWGWSVFRRGVGWTLVQGAEATPEAAMRSAEECARAELRGG